MKTETAAGPSSTTADSEPRFAELDTEELLTVIQDLEEHVTSGGAPLEAYGALAGAYKELLSRRQAPVEGSAAGEGQG